MQLAVKIKSINQSINQKFHLGGLARRYLGGYIAAAFFGMGAPSALVIGLLADRVNRRNLLFAIVLLGAQPVPADIFCAAPLAVAECADQHLQEAANLVLCGATPFGCA